MRVTDLTKQTSILQNVSNNANRLQQLQEGMATGKRISRISDDPIAATQVQDFRTKLSNSERIKQNIQANALWLDRTDAEVGHMGELLQRAKDLVLGQANDTADAASRRVTAEELQDIIDNLINAGNAKIGKVYIFAGSKTLTRPLERTPERQKAQVVTAALPTDAQLLADPGELGATFEGWSDHPYVVRITREGPMGRAMFKVSDDGGKTWSEDKSLLPDIEVVNEHGLPSDKVFLHFSGKQLDQLNNPVVFPKGVEYRFPRNPPVRYEGNEEKRMVISGEGTQLPLNLTDSELFYPDPQRPEKLDIFSLLFSLKRALNDNDPGTLEKRLNDLDRASNQILAKRADSGSVRKEMNDQLDKLKDSEVQDTKQMSDLEDLDFPTAVTELNVADVRNKSSLDTSARLIQPSLLNFLR